MLIVSGVISFFLLRIKIGQKHVLENFGYIFKVYIFTLLRWIIKSLYFCICLFLYSLPYKEKQGFVYRSFSFLWFDVCNIITFNIYQKSIWLCKLVFSSSTYLLNCQHSKILTWKLLCVYQNYVFSLYKSVLFSFFQN